MTNRKFNIIFTLISVSLMVVISIMVYMYIRNESSRYYFKLDEITGYSWVSKDVTFEMNDNKFTLTIDDKEMYKDADVTLDRMTGELIENKLYIRSVTDNNLVIWYEKEEYRLNKKIIAR